MEKGKRGKEQEKSKIRKGRQKRIRKKMEATTNKQGSV